MWNVAPALELGGGIAGVRELPSTGRPPGMEGADGMGGAVLGRTMVMTFGSWGLCWWCSD